MEETSKKVRHTAAIEATIESCPGLDVDRIEYCTKCDGSGELQPDVQCNRCEGTGIQNFEEIKLAKGEIKTELI